MKLKSLALICLCLVFGGRMASACDTLRGLEPQLQFNHWCSPIWITFFWDAYDFDKGDWDEGFGWGDICNLKRPLARTFQAIEMVNYASPTDVSSTDDFSGNFLHWAGNYTMWAFDELDGRCKSDDNPKRFAYTTYGNPDDTAELYMGFFYSQNVVERAGLLVHESRHAAWCSHNGNDGSNACPAANESCDEKFNDGCTGAFSKSGMGADAFQVMWLWWYTVDSDAKHSSPVMKIWAKDDANRILNSMFDVNPCFHITENGDKIITC